MNRQPNLLIIGAMKCATSTLHDQLAAQQGVFMSTPKEPNFFSDDEQFARGFEWYSELFDDAADAVIVGESSTHYTKRPTYSETLERLLPVLGSDVRCIYMMRHPIERLVSHYIHEWSQGVINEPIDDAVDTHPELVEYGRYAYQLAPWLQAFGHGRILPIFFERFVEQPQSELDRVASFLGYDGKFVLQDALRQRNASSERVRRSPTRDLLIGHPLAKRIRRSCVPKQFRDRIKARWSMQERPSLSEDKRTALTHVFDEDLKTLGAWLGVQLDCANFVDVAMAGSPRWARDACDVAA